MLHIAQEHALRVQLWKAQERQARQEAVLRRLAESSAMAVAERLSKMGHKPRHRIVFIAFTGEERGLLGSAHYVREPRFPLEKTIAMFNLDMVGRLTDDKLAVYGTGTAKQFDGLVERLCDSVGILARGRMVASGPVAELRRREAGRFLRVVVPDADPGWAGGLPGVRVVSQQAGDTLLELDRGTDDQTVLAAALRTGRVSHFAWREPTLVELFREAVAAPEEVAA